jgi:hypothetical protein
LQCPVVSYEEGAGVAGCPIITYAPWLPIRQLPLSVLAVLAVLHLRPATLPPLAPVAQLAVHSPHLSHLFCAVHSPHLVRSPRSPRAVCALTRPAVDAVPVPVPAPALDSESAPLAYFYIDFALELRDVHGNFRSAAGGHFHARFIRGSPYKTGARRHGKWPHRPRLRQVARGRRGELQPDLDRCRGPPHARGGWRRRGPRRVALARCARGGGIRVWTGRPAPSRKREGRLLPGSSASSRGR